ncbi:MAG: hypothetical protein MJ179_02670 [Treponema sp.]|nr:hypothetical protein [Treponema sp.]
MNKYFMQTELKRVAECFPDDKKLQTVANNCCLASCCLWDMGIDEKKHLKIILSELGKGLKNDCTVIWKHFYENVAGRKVNVTFLDIKSLSDVKNYLHSFVNYEYNGKNHWIGVEKGKIAYNSLETSECVKNGKPIEARIISLA